MYPEIERLNLKLELLHKAIQPGCEDAGRGGCRLRQHPARIEKPGGGWNDDFSGLDNELFAQKYDGNIPQNVRDNMDSGCFPNYLTREDFAQDPMEAQNRHFASGGTISNAPNNGLLAYLASEGTSPNSLTDNPDIAKRFIFDQPTKQGLADKGTITDTQTGEVWWYKSGGNNYENVTNEIVGSEIAKAVGLPSPDTRYGTHPVVNDVAYTLQRDWNQQYGGANLTDVLQLNGNKDNAPISSFNDYENLCKLALCDYVTGNQDRHNQNLILSNDGKIAALDFGDGFGSANQHVIDYFATNYRSETTLGLTLITEKTARNTIEVVSKQIGNLDLKQVRESLRAKGVPQDRINACMNYVTIRINSLHDTATVNELSQRWLSGHLSEDW